MRPGGSTRWAIPTPALGPTSTDGWESTGASTASPKHSWSMPKAFSFPNQPMAVADLQFVDGTGKSISLSDFRGRPLLLNIWATWCLPCRKEMPSLDRLQAKFDPQKFLVLPLSIDRGGIPAVE